MYGTRLNYHFAITKGNQHFVIQYDYSQSLWPLIDYNVAFKIAIVKKKGKKYVFQMLVCFVVE